MKQQNPYLNYLIDTSFQGVNRLFVLSFPGNVVRIGHTYTQYFMPSVEIKDYNVMIDRQNLFDQPIKNNIRTYNNILKNTTEQGDDHTTGC